MSNKKISELVEATQVNNNDELVIVQNGVTKKVKAEKVGTGGGGASGDTLPVGTMVPYGKNEAPTNWLICDGSAVSRTTYADLFAVIGTSYGAGDESTTFNLPNKQGKISVGLDSEDTDFNAVGKIGGEKEHELTVNEIPSHNHQVNETGGTAGIVAISSSQPGEQGNWGFNDVPEGPGSVISGLFTTSLVGGGQAHNNLQPYEVDCWIIKASQSSGVLANVAQTETNSDTDTYSCNYINEKVDGEWHDVTFSIGWQNHSDTYQSAQYKKIGNHVFLRGLIKNPNASPSTNILTVPSGFRPTKCTYFVVNENDAFCSAYMSPEGVLNVASYTQNEWIDISNINYFVD